MSKKNALYGVIVSNTCSKTVKVLVHRQAWHKKYKKIITYRKKYLVHDEHNNHNVGDRLFILPCAPISARKKFTIKS